MTLWLWCVAFSLPGTPLVSECGLWGTQASVVVVSGLCPGSVVLAPGLGCSEACEVFLVQGSNRRLLHSQADSYPLSYQGSPILRTFNMNFSSILSSPTWLVAWALFIQQSNGILVCSHNGKSLQWQPVFMEGFLYAGQCFKPLGFNSLASNCVCQWEWMNSVTAGASKDKYISDAHGWKRWSEKPSHKNRMSQTQWNNTVQGYTLRKKGNWGWVTFWFLWRGLTKSGARHLWPPRFCSLVGRSGWWAGFILTWKNRCFRKWKPWSR